MIMGRGSQVVSMGRGQGGHDGHGGWGGSLEAVTLQKVSYFTSLNPLGFKIIALQI